MMYCAETYTNRGAQMSSSNNEEFYNRLKRLYPCVDDVTKLPHAWSTEFRAPRLGFTSDNLGCYFRAGRRGEEDENVAAAVRTENHIPHSCLLYYFEIKWVTKGREGFMGLGLTTADAPLAKLPGWAQDSYGYHADDGHIYNNDGRGVPFGPTFSTGDIVGCGYNLVEGKCFFTKNGINLGKAFDNISGDIFYYPTVGLKTSGEEIEANFGQNEFMYDIEQDLRSLRKNMTLAISDYPITDFAKWQTAIHRLLQSWLFQNSYPKTAEAFTKATKLEFAEDTQRLQIRNRIQDLVLRGRIGEAIKITDQLCPNLLQNNPNLLFALKCRQFVELISGAESEFQPLIDYNTTDTTTKTSEGAKLYESRAANGKIDLKNDQQLKNSSSGAIRAPSIATSDRTTGAPEDFNNHAANSNNNRCSNGMIGDTNCEKVDDQISTSSSSYQELMDIDQPTTNNGSNSNGNSDTNSHHRIYSSSTPHSNHHSPVNGSDAIKIEAGDSVLNNRTSSLDIDEDKYAKLIQFGQELFEFSKKLDKLYGKNEHNEKLLQDAVGLIAFANPKESFLARLLEPSEREPISQMLNNSILKSELGDTHKLPMEDVMNHLRKIVGLNDSQGSWLLDELY